MKIGKKNPVIFRTIQNWFENYEAIRTDDYIKKHGGRIRYNSVVVKSLKKTLDEDLFGKHVTMKMLRPNGTFRVASLKADM